MLCCEWAEISRQNFELLRICHAGDCGLDCEIVWLCANGWLLNVWDRIANPGLKHFPWQNKKKHGRNCLGVDGAAPVTRWPLCMCSGGAAAAEHSEAKPGVRIDNEVGAGNRKFKKNDRVLLKMQHFQFEINMSRNIICKINRRFHDK